MPYLKIFKKLSDIIGKGRLCWRQGHLGGRSRSRLFRNEVLLTGFNHRKDWVSARLVRMEQHPVKGPALRFSRPWQKRSSASEKIAVRHSFLQRNPLLASFDRPLPPDFRS